jgi:hypothetical protein
MNSMTGCDSFENFASKFQSLKDLNQTERGPMSGISAIVLGSFLKDTGP